MSVHYKFKSSLDFDTITFDGLHISVNDFRKAVVQQKRLGKTNDFELQITNAQTKEEYENDNDLIPKNTSLIISRIPQTSKKSRDSQNLSTPNVCPIPKFDSNTLDLSQMNASEEDKIQAMMAQSTADYDPRGYQKLRGPGQTGEVPPTYRCYKCHQTGHWIKHCPLPHSSSKKNEIKRNTGIPKSFLQEKGLKQLSTDEIVLVEQQAEVPDELLCSICKDIFRDAVMIPCCGSSFCDDCVRTALLESDENECPDCKEKGTSPGSLIPNRFLRSAVNTFKNETGYERTGKIIGRQEVVIDSAGDTALNRSDKPNTVIEDKSNDVRRSLDDESIKPTYSPKSESQLTVNDNNCKIISTEDRKTSHHKSVQSASPENQFEIATSQQDVVQNLDISTETQETFKQTSPSKFSNYVHPIPELPQRSNAIDPYPLRPDSYVRHTKHNLVIAPPHVAYCNNYGNRTERYFYPRDNYNVNNAPFSYLPNTRCRQMVPHSGIQPYYQGISGPLDGIIEDPLEAFNRIMKEKEKRKEMKRLVSERQRTATVKRNHRDISPVGDKRSRRRISPVNERRNRSPFRQEKPSNHRNVERDKNIRGHRAVFTNNKRSFSRSNSPPQRRYSKSKSPRRRSRSRSHLRSHSREMDLIRNDNKPKHNVLQSHRTDYEKDVMQHNRRHPRRFSETKIASEAGPKENRRHNSKMKENGCQSFYNFEEQNSRRTLIETDDFQEKRDLYIGYDDKSKACEGVIKMEKMYRDHESKKHHVQLDEEPSKQEAEKKNKERRRKKEKDEKLEKKSKRDKKDKRKRERCKEDQKKHSEHKRTRKETDRSSNTNITNNGDSKIQPRFTRKDVIKSPKDSSLEDRNETFTPDINATRNQELDDTVEISEKKLVEDNMHSIDNSDILIKDEGRHQDIDTNFFGVNTPTSIFDTTPENYAGKWDNFDFSIPNSEGMRSEDNRDCEHDVRLFQNSFATQRDDPIENSRTSNKNRDPYSRSQQEVGKFENENILRRKRPNSLKMASSPMPSEGMSSSSKNSNVDKPSPLKKRRKKSKHKKDKQYCKRSSSADSSKNLRKVASKHKKIRSERKKKSRRNESR